LILQIKSLILQNNVVDPADQRFDPCRAPWLIPQIKSLILQSTVVDPADQKFDPAEQRG
jgi:hypothetical protein